MNADYYIYLFCDYSYSFIFAPFKIFLYNFIYKINHKIKYFKKLRKISVDHFIYFFVL